MGGGDSRQWGEQGKTMSGRSCRTSVRLLWYAVRNPYAKEVAKENGRKRAERY